MKHQTVASNFPLQVSNLDCNLEFSMNDGTNICVWMLNVTSSVFQHVNIVIIVARLKLILVCPPPSLSIHGHNLK